MKQLKFSLVFFSILLINFVFTKVIFSADANNILAKSLNAVVGVYVEEKNGEVNPVGSAVIVKSNGLVLTNDHVVGKHSNFIILMVNGISYSAKLLITEPTLDLALLQIENLQNDVFFLDTDVVDYDVGDDVYAIGNPRNVGISVTKGIISALPSKNNSFGLGNLIQTDAAINPGSSGGALINSKGKLIGLNTFIISNTNGFSGIGFAVPVKTINLFVSRFLSNKKIRQYWVGIGGVNLDYKLATKYGLKIPSGVFVTQIYPNSPALKAGLQYNDIIVKFAGSNITSMSDLLFLVSSLDSDQNISMIVLRDRKLVELNMIPEKTEDIVDEAKLKFTSGVLAGITVVNNSNIVSYQLNTISLDGVVVYDIENSSYLSKLGVIKGDFIKSINGNEIKNIIELNKIMKEIVNFKEYKFTLIRGNTNIDITVTSTTGF